MTTIIKPIGKVGKGGAKMVKAGTKGVLKAAKKGVSTSSSGHSSPSFASRVADPSAGGSRSASMGYPGDGRAVRSGPLQKSGASAGAKSGSLSAGGGGEEDETDDVADAWTRKLKKELISPEEEKLLEDLLLKEDVFTGDTVTEELVNNLTTQVYALDTANVYTLLSSGVAMQDLIQSIDITDGQLDELHTWLSYYDNQLNYIQKYIKQIEENNNEMEILTRNQHSLLEELDSVISAFTLEENTTSLLTFGELEAGTQLDLVVGAADRWETRYKAAVLLRDTSPEIARMIAVQRQIAEFERLRDVFAARLDRFLTELFLNFRIDGSDAKTQLKDHKNVYQMLTPYQELMHWLQRNRFSTYLQLAQTYTDSMQRLYEEEQRAFFAELRKIVPKEPRESLKFVTPAITAPAHPGQTKIRKIEKELRKSLGEWIFTAAREQIFSEEFFNFPPSRETTRSVLLGSGEVENESLRQQRKVQATGSLESLLAQSLSAGSSAWNALFGAVTKYDYLILLGLIVEMEGQINKYEKDSTAMAQLLVQELLIPAIRLWNRALEEEASSIQSFQPSIKAVGILHPIYKFPLIVEEMEARIVESSALGRRIANQALKRLYATIADWINSLGSDEPKLRLVVRSENFRYLYLQLWPEPKRGPRTDCLKTELEQALRHVDESLTEFIRKLIGSKKNFLPLVTFFDGIEELLRTLPPEEIQFQSSHSSEAFTRLTPVLSRPRVEKRIAAMLRHISRNFGKEAGLVPVAFTRLQEIFLSDYGRYEKLTSQCYRHHKLPITASDIQEIFNATQQQYV